ncbi:MAG: RNase adapter RapZ [Lysobacteraceae bacterium]|nr:RNase adapter RapZ [Rhodanobacteraceae bacterium]HPF74794.1 RNase adapter RapZ [Xanthomonadaceae bacterium]HRY01222.1 RNase adapter RapZ [Xanthomonadaceae bacterium]
MVTSNDNATPLIVVSGLSGSGKTVVLRTLEDLDYYCVDNLPAELLPAFVRSVSGDDGHPPRMAVGIDVRNRSRDLDHLPASLSAVGALGIDYQLIFLDTRDEVLIKRYSDTRRRHPLSQGGLPLARAIAEERQRLGPLKALAAQVIDSSDMNVHQLRRWVVTDLAAGASDGLSLLIESFAYRRGVPADADFVFDARCLPNPHWEPSLRPLSGRDAGVRDWLRGQERVVEYVDGVTTFLDTWLPRFAAETRSYLTVAFGCTGGRHRSVFLAETLAEHCRAREYGAVVSFHRELE